MSKHTPGPWIADGPPNNIHILEEARPHMRVCFMTSDGPAVANARLIAAAPDMLAALESLTKDPPSTFAREPDEDWEVIIKMRAIARAAIAKATTP